MSTNPRLGSHFEPIKPTYRAPLTSRDNIYLRELGAPTPRRRWQFGFIFEAFEGVVILAGTIGFVACLIWLTSH